MPFDRSCIYPFRLDGDGFLYAMIDARLAQEAAQGLTQAQKTTLNGFRWTPAPGQNVPTWGGNDPAPIYFRATDAQVKAALARRYTAPTVDNPEDLPDSYTTV